MLDVDFLSLPVHLIDNRLVTTPIILYLIYLRHVKSKELEKRIRRLEVNYQPYEEHMNIIHKYCSPERYQKGRKYYFGKDTIFPWLVGKQAPINTIVYHQMAGWLPGTDATFAKGSGGSAHFGVGQTEIHQYVSMDDATYGCGSAKGNCEAVQIEHETGEVKQPDGSYRDYGFSGDVYENSAQLVVHIAKSLGKKVADFKHLPHNNFENTRCPGSLDYQSIVRRAMEIEALENFNEAAYLSANEDVAREVSEGKFISGYEHYQKFGKAEGRSPVGAARIIPASYSVPVVETFELNLEPSQEVREEVKRVQRFLIKLGYMTDDIAPENQGKYGPKTQAAIDRFQKDNGINASASYYGWWYNSTRAKANSILLSNPSKFV